MLLQIYCARRQSKSAPGLRARMKKRRIRNKRGVS